MKKFNQTPFFFLAWSSVICSIAVHPGCSTKSPADVSGISGDSLSNSDRAGTITRIKSAFNADVVITDNSYEAEYQVNRILRYLVQNQDAVRPKLMGAVEIDIGTTFGTREVTPGKLAVSLDDTATEKRLQYFLDQLSDTYNVNSTLQSSNTRLGLTSIVDNIGMTPQQATDFTTNLTTAIQGYDFTLPYASPLANVVADRVYAWTSNSMIVPFDGSADGIRSFVGADLALAKHLAQDLADAGTTLGVSVAIQPGVLMPSEITSGITNLTSSKSVFTNAIRLKKDILIGRRTETDQSLARSRSRLLISFQASPSEIDGALALLGDNSQGVLSPLVTTFLQAYQVYGISSNISAGSFKMNASAVDASIDLAKALMAQIQSEAPATRLSADGMTSLNLVDSSSPVSCSGGVLYLPIGGTIPPGAIDAALKGYEIQLQKQNSDQKTGNLHRDRQQLECKIIQDLSQTYGSSGISISVSCDNLDWSRDNGAQLVSNTIAFIPTIAPASRLVKDGISELDFVARSLSPSESVIVDGNKLSIDPFTATPAVLEGALRAKEILPPPPAPTPTPVATPAPTPASFRFNQPQY